MLTRTPARRAVTREHHLHVLFRGGCASGYRGRPRRHRWSDRRLYLSRSGRPITSLSRRLRQERLGRQLHSREECPGQEGEGSTASPMRLTSWPSMHTISITGTMKWTPCSAKNSSSFGPPEWSYSGPGAAPSIPESRSTSVRDHDRAGRRAAGSSPGKWAKAYRFANSSVGGSTALRGSIRPCCTQGPGSRSQMRGRRICPGLCAN